MNIREAKPEESESISLLINSVAHYCTLDPNGKGAESFFDSISPDEIRGYILSGSYYYIVALEEDELAGVAALKEETHLFHFFVAPRFQKKGLSRRLWDAIQDGAKHGNKEFTVNSTSYAVPVYEKLGFVVTGSRTEMNGIAFVPMEIVSG